jgi:hypothetical protein
MGGSDWKMARLELSEAAEQACRRDWVILSIVLFCLVGSAWAAGPPATTATVKLLPQLAKAKVQALGLGARIKMTTVFRLKYQGYITRIDDNSFEVVDVKSLTPNLFQYSAVDQVTGRQLSKPADHARKPGVKSLFSMVSRAGFGP